jgi:Sel1 repeat
MTNRKSKGVLQRVSGGVLSSSEKSGSIIDRGRAALAQITDAEACFQHARAAYKIQNFSETVLWCRKAAEKGHATAQRNLGFCYEFGIGVTRDDAQAVLWYRKSVEHGDSEGQNAVRAITRDDVQSVLRHRVQADNSLSRARMRLYEARIRLGLPCDEYEQRLRGLPTFDDDLFSADWRV